MFDRGIPFVHVRLSLSPKVLYVCDRYDRVEDLAVRRCSADINPQDDGLREEVCANGEACRAPLPGPMY